MKNIIILALALVAITTAWEGCSHGFWKQNTEYWAFKLPEERFNDSFAGIGPSNSLIEALRFRHAKQNHLVREAVGALLNALHPDIDYRYTSRNVTDIVTQGFASQEWEYYAWLLEDASTTYKCPCKENCRKGESFTQPETSTASPSTTSTTTTSTESTTTSASNPSTASTTSTSTESTTTSSTMTRSEGSSTMTLSPSMTTTDSPTDTTTTSTSETSDVMTEHFFATGSESQTILSASATASGKHQATSTSTSMEMTTTPSPPVETTTQAETSSPTEGLSPGVVSGIVLGTFFGVGAIALAAGIGWRKCRP